MELELQNIKNELEDLKKDLALFKEHDHFLGGGAPLSLKNLPFYGLHHAQANLYATAAATSTNYDSFFNADFDLEIIAVEESHRQAGTDLPVTLDIYKLTTGQALGSGVTVLSTTFNLASTAETPVRVTPTTTRSNRILKRGDRLGMVLSGTPTSVNQLTVNVYFLPL